MAKKQTRRAVRISNQLFARLDIYCKAKGISNSAAVEEALKPILQPSPESPDGETQEN